MEERTSNVCYAIGKSYYGTAYFYESPVLPGTLREFRDLAGQGELKIFPRLRLAEITRIPLEDILSAPDGTWYKIDGGRLLESGQLE